MTTTIELSNGQSAVLIDAELVSQSRRRPVEKALMNLSKSGKALSALTDTTDLSDANIDLSVLDQYTELNDLMVLARLESWTLDLPITLDSLLDIPDPDYKALQAAVAGDALKMMPSFGASNDPNSPIKPSNA